MLCLISVSRQVVCYISSEMIYVSKRSDNLIFRRSHICKRVCKLMRMTFICVAVVWLYFGNLIIIDVSLGAVY